MEEGRARAVDRLWLRGGGRARATGKRLEGQGWRVDRLRDGSSIQVRGDIREHRIVLEQSRGYMGVVGTERAAE